MAFTASNLKTASLVGRSAPPFRLRDQDGRWTELADLIGQGPVVLAFYPLDFSPVCTKQLCGYRDAYEAIRAAGVRIVGISPDPPERHRKFIADRRLPFQLLSDPDRLVFKAYGVTSRWFGIRTRGLIVIGGDGRVLAEKIESTPLTHRGAADLLAMIETVKSAEGR